MKPRVLHVVETWRPVSSGYTSRGWQIVAAQLETGVCDPFVLVSSRQALHGVDRGEMPGRLGQRSIRIASSPYSERAIRRLRPFYTSVYSLARQIESACREWDIDIVHCHWASGIGAAARLAAGRTGAKLIGEIRFDLAGAMMSETVRYPVPGLETLLRLRFDRFLRGADAVVAASHTLSDLVRRSQKGLSGAVAVMPNAVDCQRFHPGIDTSGLRRDLGLDGAFIVGTTTNMLRYEGLDVLLDAAERLQSSMPDLRIVLVGNGTQYESLKKQAALRALPVMFVGRVSADSIPTYLNLFDLFVVPRRDMAVTRYASPIKLVEALACGVPCVASALGDIPGILAGGSGRAIPPGDAGVLAAAIRDFALDPELRETSARSARAWALAQPDWLALARRYGALYDTLRDREGSR